MTLDALIMLAGAFVAALPFLGVPYAWLQWLIFVFGIFVIALGIAVRRRLFQKAHTQQKDVDGETKS